MSPGPPAACPPAPGRGLPAAALRRGRRGGSGGGRSAGAGEERREPRRCPRRTAAWCGTCSQPCCCTVSALPAGLGPRAAPKAAGVRGGPEPLWGRRGARVGALSRGARGRWVPPARGGGWEAGSPRWLCLTPVLVEPPCSTRGSGAAESAWDSLDGAVGTPWIE